MGPPRYLARSGPVFMRNRMRQASALTTLACLVESTTTLLSLIVTALGLLTSCFGMCTLSTPFFQSARTQVELWWRKHGAIRARQPCAQLRKGLPKTRYRSSVASQQMRSPVYTARCWRHKERDTSHRDFTTRKRNALQLLQGRKWCAKVNMKR